MILIDVYNNKIEDLDDPSIPMMKAAIGCRNLEVSSRTIGDMRYSIFCDEEGRYREDPVVSAVNESGEAVFVGNLIVSGRLNEWGMPIPMSEEEKENLKCHITLALYDEYVPNFILFNVED